MIVVVEGPSAAGKTTWTSTFPPELVVPEHGAMHPSSDDPELAARFWAGAGADRWAQARRIESIHGMAVCDTDPLKLHYSWSLWRIGECGDSELLPQIAAYREAVAEGRIGFADLYYVEIPDARALAERKENDPSRQRRNFNVHSRLGEPLREWYGAVDELRPRSVVWNYPEQLPRPAPPQTDPWPDDLMTFDRLMERVTDAH